VEYLRSQTERIQLIENPENRGFPAANNQGIRIAGGDRVLLLNNDTIAPRGWLGRMLRVFELDPRIGLVGPQSNHVSGPQMIPVRYDTRTLSGLDEFSQELEDAAEQREPTHTIVVESTSRLVGFCLLIRRQVIDEIGLLDERFGLGNWEDDDYCRRAIQAGWHCRIARNAFVHHYGSRCYSQICDLQALIDENRGKYLEKWGS